MTKIFLFGEAPLPMQDSAKRPAGGLRTWQFLQQLRENGHEVQAVLLTRPDFWENGVVPAADDLAVYLDRDDPRWKKRTQKLLKDFQPEAVVAINSLASERISKLKFDAPLWADINGSPLMEAQAQAWRIGSNSLLPHFWAREQRILQTADMISTCSERQKMATLGMLATLGRLGQRTCGELNVTAIPNLTEIWPEIDEVSVDAEPLLRGVKVPADAVIVSMLGGWWNSWLDEDTLFAGLEAAMTQNEKIYFVAGGGAVPGLTLAPLDNFRGKMEKSQFHERFVLLGWVPTRELAQLYREVDFCVNADRLCADTLTGARNRITEWAKFGLPVVTTRGTEIADEMIAGGAAVGVDIGDSATFTDAILWLADNLSLRQRLGQLAQKFCTEKWNYRTGMREFIEWAAHPRCAGDFEDEVSMKTGFWHTKVCAGWRYLRENGWGRAFSKMVAYLREN